MALSFFRARANEQLNSWQVLYLIVCSLGIVTWLKHDRLQEYWQQTYQSNGYWNSLDSYTSWQQGVSLAANMNPQPVQEWMAHVNLAINDSLNNYFYSSFLRHQKFLAEQAAKVETIAQQEQAIETTIQAQKHLYEEKYNPSHSLNQSAVLPTLDNPSISPLTKISLTKNKQVFFAGDSMMQGVAPWVMRELQAKYAIRSINLSKQSTGLSYTKLFDWNATIEKTLDEHSDIGALIIFLGPNDPWAVPDPTNIGGKYIEFATPRWNELYKDKIQHILTAANNHHVQVMWMIPPAMKKPQLNEQMLQLQQIIHQSIAPSQALIIDSRPLLEVSLNSGYADSLAIDGKLTKVRTADGIHFTPDGQKFLANAILSHIDITQDKSL